jgi:hypothetical protein
MERAKATKQTLLSCSCSPSYTLQRSKEQEREEAKSGVCFAPVPKGKKGEKRDPLSLKRERYFV